MLAALTESLAGRRRHSSVRSPPVRCRGSPRSATHGAGRYPRHRVAHRALKRRDTARDEHHLRALRAHAYAIARPIPGAAAGDDSDPMVRRNSAAVTSWHQRNPTRQRRQADSYGRVGTKTRDGQAPRRCQATLMVRIMQSSRASPASFIVISRRSRPESVNVDVFAHRAHGFGLAQILITSGIGLPMTLPCPVGKKCTTYPAAAQSVTISAAADDDP